MLDNAEDKTQKQAKLLHLVAAWGAGIRMQDQNATFGQCLFVCSQSCLWPNLVFLRS